MQHVYKITRKIWLVYRKDKLGTVEVYETDARVFPAFKQTRFAVYTVSLGPISNLNSILIFSQVLFDCLKGILDQGIFSVL